MHMDFASSYTDANGVLLRVWRIALSITSGGVLNAALPSKPSSEMRAGRKWPSSTQWHRSRGPAQVHYESRELKVPSCWDRDKLCVDPLCRTLNLNINFHFCTKKPLLLDHKIRYEDFVFGKYVHIVWAIREYY
jgi:hypothetical protein